ncbi:MAG: hypothetical protein Q9183_001868 [Haloplaca sp. 2 TL-2023]
MVYGQPQRVEDTIPDISLRNKTLSPLSRYDLYRYFDKSYQYNMEDAPFQRVPDASRPPFGPPLDDGFGEIILVWTHTPGITDLRYGSESFNNVLIGLYTWLTFDDAVTVSIVGPETGQPYFIGNDVCEIAQCAAPAMCNAMYYCLYQDLLEGPFAGWFRNRLPLFHDCLYEKYGIDHRDGDPSAWRCAILLSSYTRKLTFNQLQPCNADIYNLSQSNWRDQHVDRNILTSQQGGIDTLGVYWEGRGEGETFSQSFGLQFWNLLGLQCSLASPCQQGLDCSAIGSFTAVALGRYPQPMRLPWVVLASVAFKNIDQQLRNQFSELGDAIESLGLNTFSVDVFFPTKEQNVNFQNGLAGLSGILSILGGFLPVVGPSVSAVGTIVSGLGTFFSESIADATDPQQAQKVFADQVTDFYTAALAAMDDTVAKLFAGESISAPGNKSFNITDMMKDGAWVNTSALTPVSELNRKIKIETLSRSIDALWKTPPHNKLWVLFTDLHDDMNGTLCQDRK